MSIKQITKLRYKTKDKPPMEGVPLLGYNKRYDCPWIVVYRSKDKYYTCMKYDTEFETYPPEEYEYGKGDNYYTNMECDVEYKTSPPDEYEYVYP